MRPIDYECPEGVINKYVNKSLEEVWNVLSCISDNLASKPTMGKSKKGLFMFGHELVTSSLNSVETMNYCLSRRFFSDAFTLLRKVRDNLFLSLFLIESLEKVGIENNSESDDDEDDYSRFRNFTYKKLSDEVKKKVEIYGAEAWLYNDLAGEDFRAIKRELFDFSKFFAILRDSSSELQTICSQFFEGTNSKIDLKALDRKLNNYVHVNGKKYTTDNFRAGDKLDFDDFENALDDLIVVFLSFVSIIDSSLLHSSDYLDALEMGEVPTIGSQYWLAPCIYDYMHVHFEQPLLDYLQEHQKYGMEIVDNLSENGA